jgi:hypothetical protein
MQPVAGIDQKMGSAPKKNPRQHYFEGDGTFLDRINGQLA